MTIRIVTDSVCDIPPETAKELQITVIPAYLNIGDESYLDGIELTHQEFYERLPSLSVMPTTAAPAPGTFAEAYERLGAEGATEILSIHIASSLSGILNAARIGAQSIDSVRVELFDSQQITMGLGLLVITAAEGAAAGDSMDQIVSRLNDLVNRTYVFGLLDTLDYLRKGGRVNWTSYGIGTLLRIKPLLQIHMGQVQMLERVRTSGKAFLRFLEVASELAPFERMTLLHTHAEKSRLDELYEKTRYLFPGGQSPLMVEITPALGVHLGPKGLGIAGITKN